MNIRTLVFRGAIGLLVIGALLSLASLRRAAPPPPTVTVAVAERSIEPYTILTSAMIGAGATMPQTEAMARGAFPITAVDGLMTTSRLAPGDLITTGRALPAGDVRFIQDLRLEIVSFAAGLDRLVGGRVRPGHRINIYGTGRDARNRTFTELVERAALVVQVSAGGQAVAEAMAVPDLVTGEIHRATEDRGRAVTMITVALAPTRVLHLIDALSARQLEPWVTLAAVGQANIVPLPTDALPTPPMPLKGPSEYALPERTGREDMPVLGGGGASRPTRPTQVTPTP
ncbi:MAG: hypothetical protein ABI780_03910 [Ardenticatenales bacterium]